MYMKVGSLSLASFRTVRPKWAHLGCALFAYCSRALPPSGGCGLEGRSHKRRVNLLRGGNQDQRAYNLCKYAGLKFDIASSPFPDLAELGIRIRREHNPD